MVEKLEVVNKKWVRVRLPPGNNVSDGVILAFRITVVNKYNQL